ncbi:MAG: GDP-mannose mannosyl hydrolase [Aquificae bacterium]|nr:GDP-mannose mannosyl hydrolase [Aquificota bacterium]
MFKFIIQNTPLVAIDLIVKDKEGKILLGKRKNRPAKNFYFVPGGRIFKNERLDEAFESITENELGIPLKRQNAKFLGVYEHIYPDNFFGNEFGTHYIVLAHIIEIDFELPLPKDQHEDYIWLTPTQILKREDIHEYTKNYFRGNLDELK